MRSGPYTTQYFCSYAPRLDISLKKNTATLKFDLDLPVAEFQAMVFAKKYFRTGSIFFSNLQTAVIFFQKKNYIYKFVTSGWKFFFLRIPSPRIPQQVGRVHISRSCVFFKRDIQPRGIFIFFQKKLYLQVCKFEKKYFRLENIFFANTVA